MATGSTFDSEILYKLARNGNGVKGFLEQFVFCVKEALDGRKQLRKLGVPFTKRKPFRHVPIGHAGFLDKEVSMNVSLPIFVREART
jgi:hypothetical protein